MWSVALASPARLTSSIFGLAVAISCGAPHHSLLVTVTRAGQPWPGVVVTLRSPGTDRVAASAATGADGTARLDKLDPGPVTVEALAIEDDRSAYCIVTLDVRQAESALHLRAESDFIVGGALRAFPAAVDAAPAGAAAETSERAARAALVPAVLEIDRVGGTPRVALAAPTRGGLLTLEQILRDAGYSLEVVWDQVVPRSRIPGFPAWPELSDLAGLMDELRTEPPPPGGVRFHILLAPWNHPFHELSLLVDPETRQSSVVGIDPDRLDPREILHAVVHEIGHQLGLRHPWEEGSDRRTAMTYPWHWPDWDWSDPRVFTLPLPADSEPGRTNH